MSTPLSREELEDDITNIFITVENYGTAEEARVDIRELISKHLKAFADEVERGVMPKYCGQDTCAGYKCLHYVEQKSALKDLLEKWGASSRKAQDDK